MCDRWRPLAFGLRECRSNELGSAGFTSDCVGAIAPVAGGPVPSCTACGRSASKLRTWGELTHDGGASSSRGHHGPAAGQGPKLVHSRVVPLRHTPGEQAHEMPRMGLPSVGGESASCAQHAFGEVFAAPRLVAQESEHSELQAELAAARLEVEWAVRARGRKRAAHKPRTVDMQRHQRQEAPSGKRMAVHAVAPTTLLPRRPTSLS